MQYLSSSEYYKKVFGVKVYRLALDLGCTCPNRDGTKSVLGCIFCNAVGSGDFTSDKTLSIPEQIENAKHFVEKKLLGRSRCNDIACNTFSTTQFVSASKKCGKYLAYFQSFTNTYGDVKYLEKKYWEAILYPDIVGIIIATRPDCLSEEILQVLSKIAKKTYLSVELGLQTSNDFTATFINRQYATSVYIEAVEKLHKVSPNIHVVTHLIFGLPNETEKDMLASVSCAVNSHTDGLKITVLNVLRRTKLQELYEKNLYSEMSQETYFALLKKALELIPKNIVIHRLTGDGAKRDLLAPMWVANKKKVLNDWSLFCRTH